MQRRYNANKAPIKAEHHTAHKFQADQKFYSKKIKRGTLSTARVITALYDINLSPTDIVSIGTTALTVNLNFLFKAMSIATSDMRSINTNKILLLYLLVVQIQLASAVTECLTSDVHGPAFYLACKLQGVTTDYIRMHHLGIPSQFSENVKACRYDIVCRNDQDQEQVFAFKHSDKPADGFDLHYDGIQLFRRVKCGGFFPESCATPHHDYDIDPVKTTKPANQ